MGRSGWVVLASLQLLSPGLCVLSILDAPARAGEATALGTLSGTVHDPDGKPVAGARVWTDTYDRNTSSMKTLAEARTDAEGRFRLGPVVPVYRHRFDLIIDADGFARLSILSGTYSIFPGIDNDLGTIPLDRGRVFTGQVLDVDGKPRPNATVKSTVYRHYLGHTVNDIGPKQTLTTDAEGRFRTPPLPVGQLGLSVQASERQLAHVSRAIRPGGEEALEPIRLKEDVPVTGFVKDEDGMPIAGVKIGGTVGHEATTDAEGKFTLRGFGPNPTFQMNVSREGYASLVGMVKVSEKGIRYSYRDGDGVGEPEPAKELIVVLRRVGWIEGEAVDVDTGQPVHLNKVVVCNFERKPSGEVVLRGCRSEKFEQPEDGRFRVPFPAPDEYHLTFSAAGYHDAEAFTPKVTDLKTIGGIVARMKQKTDGSTPALATQTIVANVTRDGRPVEAGWVGLWALKRPANAPNAPVMRGRTVEGEPIIYARATIRDGAYVLDVPFQSESWYVVVEEPGHSLAQVGPISIALNQRKRLDITCTEGGRIRGRVKDVPRGWEGHLWVVAFSKSGVRAETRIDLSGEFSLPPLPPGEYGVKVGHDAYEDAEVYPGRLSRDHPESFKMMADPWKRAKVVTVDAGRDPAGVELELP